MSPIPEDVKNFRADPGRMRQLLVTVAATAAVMLTITAHTMSFQDEVLMEQMRAEAAEQRAKQYEEDSQLAKHLNALVTACMSGKRWWVWTDPLTNADMATFCETVMLGRIGR